MVAINKLIDAFSGEPEQKEFKLAGHLFVLRTLTQRELNNVIVSSPKTGTNFMEVLELQKIPILARSLVSIDGIPIQAAKEVRDIIDKSESKDVDVIKVIENLLEDIDGNSINLLFNWYIELRDSNYANKEKLKNV